jgi:UDP-N-acetylmuramoyl-L-alanyl-D-glutamate--2,6-diaminopimelate ligase
VLYDPADRAVAATGVPQFAVPDLRQRASFIAGVFHGHPSRDLWMVAVTGTNGKTSTAHWIAQALEGTGGPPQGTPDRSSGVAAFGKRVGGPAAVLGTLGNGPVGAATESTHTTPDALELQQLLAHYRAAGMVSVAMEVSSHGLDQGRVAAIHYDVAVFTNLSRDHLDYHGSMEAYGEAKARLFRMPSITWAVINADDKFGQRLMVEAASDRCRVLTYGIAQGLLRARDLVEADTGLAFTLDSPCGTVPVKVPVLGRFNVYNLLATAGALLASGLDMRAVAERLSALTPVRGRMQRLGGGPGLPLVVIDYAHTPDALEKALRALRPSCGADGRLIALFGCGGDRDRGKRPLMGEVAARAADFSVITSDNPRSEDPQAIITDLLPGLGSAAHRVQVDRRLAIIEAIDEAKPGDVLLIAGKGHETYQEVAGVRHAFDDAAIAGARLEARSCCN